MLPEKHRIRAPRDFSVVTRTGTRAGTRSVVVSLAIRDQTATSAAPSESATVSWRCGFIVSKAVGNAVVRHRTTRRLRHIVREVLPQFAATQPDGSQIDVVVRALAACVDLNHEELTADVRSGIKRALRKASAAQDQRASGQESGSPHV